MSPLEPVALKRTPPEDAATTTNPSEYGGVGDFEDLKPTQVAKPAGADDGAPSAADRRKLLMERLRRRTGRSDAPEKSDDGLPGRAPVPPAPRPTPRRRQEPDEEEEHKTQMFTAFPKQDMEDAATQMFTRDMIEDIAGELEDDDSDEEDSGYED